MLRVLCLMAMAAVLGAVGLAHHAKAKPAPANNLVTTITMDDPVPNGQILNTATCTGSYSGAANPLVILVYIWDQNNVHIGTLSCTAIPSSPCSTDGTWSSAPVGLNAQPGCTFEAVIFGSLASDTALNVEIK